MKKFLATLLCLAALLLNAVASSKSRYKKQFVEYESQNADLSSSDNLYGAGGSEQLMDGGNEGGDGGMFNSFGELGSSRDSMSSMDAGGLGDGGGGLSDLSSYLNDASSVNQGENEQIGLATDSASDFKDEPSLLSGLDDGYSSDNNNNNNNILSSFSDDSFGSKLENSVNLGDSISSEQSDVTSSPLKSKPPHDVVGTFEKLLGNADYEGVNHHHKQKAAGENKQHDIGDGREGIGAKISGMQDLLQNELGQLDTADEKLQKMLESGIDSDSSNFADSSTATSSSSMTSSPGMADMSLPQTSQVSADANLLNSLQNQMNQLEDPIPGDDSSSQYQGSPSDFSASEDMLQQQQQQQQQEQQNELTNQMSGTMTQSAMEGIQPITIHAHASDKSSKQSQKQANSEASQQLAAQVQEDAHKNHEHKLVKLKSRLKLLRQKLAQLEEEQAKKSSSNSNEEKPRTSRNNAIKRLLIKNLKLAAMIASKEIKLEEAKGRSLDYLSGKKGDNVKDGKDTEAKPLVNNATADTSSRPITELSRKAEEEVNHLTKNRPQRGSTRNLSTEKSNETLAKNQNNTTPDKQSNENSLKSSAKKNITSAIEQSEDADVSHKTDYITKINETLQILDKSGSRRNNTSSSRDILVNSSKEFLQELTTKVNLMEPSKARGVQEKALATLYNAIKVKAAASAKKRNKFIYPYMIHQEITKENATMTTS